MSSNPLADLVAGARRDLDLQFAADAQQELELTAAEQWARDPVGWINEHVWIASFLPTDGHDRQQVRPVKMLLFPDQELTVRSWIDVDHLHATGKLRFLGNVVIEKSRQIGETWLFAALVCWLVHHHSVSGLCMHVDLAEIDDGGNSNTSKSLFGKVRYIDRKLSRDRLPYLGAQLVFRQKPSKIESPRNGSVVYGEGQSDDPGRGQSLDFAVVDEAARVQHGELVHASLADACPTGKAYLSTPKGSGNMHSRLSDSKPKGWTYLRLHWSAHPVFGRGQHIAGSDPAACQLCAGTAVGIRWESSDPRAHRYPGKLTSPWYDEAVLDKTDEQVAGELDIDREGSLPGRVFTEFDTATHVIEAGIPYEYDLGIELAWDYGLDTTSVIVLQHGLQEVRALGLLEMGSQHGTSGVPEHVAAELRLFLQELGVPTVETTPEFTRLLRAIGDPSGHARELGTGKAVASQYRRQGFNIGKPPSRYRSVKVTVDAVKRLLVGSPKPLRICGVNAAGLATHLASNRWKSDAVGQVRYGSAMDLEDDVHNHACRALAYWAVATFAPPDARLNYPPTSTDDEPEPQRMPLTERRRRAMRRVTAGGDLDDDLPFADAAASL